MAGHGSVSLDGRALGRRGAATRRRLLDATAARLETGGLRDLRVADVARDAGTSPATFYQYFRDVPDAVLALAHDVGEQAAPLGELLERDWRGAGGLDAARALVEGFITFWDRNRAILRTRNLAAQEGDERFRRVRNRSLEPLLEGIARKVEAAGADGLAPYVAAAALVAMMERMAAFHTDLEIYAITRDDVVETTARILFATATSAGVADAAGETATGAGAAG